MSKKTRRRLDAALKANVALEGRGRRRQSLSWPRNISIT
jgi:hypothetical protein